MRSDSDGFIQPKSFSTKALKKTFLSLGASDEILQRLEREARDRKLISAFAIAAKKEEREIIEIVAKRVSVDSHQIEDLRSLSRDYDQQLKLKFNRTFALENRIFPIKNDNGNFIVGFADPLDIDLYNEIRFRIGAPLRIVIMSEQEIISAVNAIFSDVRSDAIGLEFYQAQTDDEVEFLPKFNDQRILNIEDEDNEPVIRFVNRILSKAVASGASDIHLEPLESGLDVRFRIDGVVHSVFRAPEQVHPYIIARIKLLAGMDISEKRRPQDGRFKIKVSDSHQCELRVSSVKTQFGEKLVLRLLSSDQEVASLNSIGMPEDVSSIWQRALKSNDRINIVCGPTGSGKSTTLFASISEISSGSNNIVTVEDPIEYRIAGATQIEVNPKIGVTFASGLRSILRQDPDVILVGEVRDLETAEIAFQAAQTGHQVLTTLHTNDAASSIIRLRDMGLESSVIAASLGAVIAQRLVRTICSDCKTTTPVEKTESWNKELCLTEEQFSIGEGCSNCGFSGFKGRTAVYSILPMTPDIRELIRKEASESAIEVLAKKSGMKTLREAAIELVIAGITTHDEVVRVIGLNSLAEENHPDIVSQTAKNISLNVDEKYLYSHCPASSNPSEQKKEEVLRMITPEIEQTVSVLQLAEEIQEAKDVKVLVIDDDIKIRTLMTRMLKSCGFEVLQASHGLQGLEELESFGPDIVVCDLEMPHLNGKDFVKRLRAINKFSNLPVIMLTSADCEGNEIDLLSTGASDFVSKTSSLKLVAARINRLLATKPNSSSALN